VINNVVYDVRHGFVHHNPATGEFHLVGNYFRRGPSSELFPFFFDDEAQPGDEGYFLRDNFIDDPPQLERAVDDIWATPFAHESFENAGGQASRVTNPADFGAADAGYVAVTQQASAAAYALVLERAGSCPRDVVTRDTVAEVQARNGGWGATEPGDLMAGLTPAAAPTDADGDGMADAWEATHGLDPGDGADHATVRPSGYTAIEEYVNELADACGGLPPVDGGATGGRGGTGGAGGAGGASGGAGARGGAGGAGGSGASGGAGGPGGASGGGASGSPGSGGGPAAAPGSDSGGCGCAVPADHHAGELALVIAVLAAALRGKARRRRARLG
jgi:hypothetical protein